MNGDTPSRDEVKESPKRILSPTTQTVAEDGNNPSFSPKRVKLSSNSSPQELGLQMAKCGLAEALDPVRRLPPIPRGPAYPTTPSNSLQAVSRLALLVIENMKSHPQEFPFVLESPTSSPYMPNGLPIRGYLKPSDEKRGSDSKLKGSSSRTAKPDPGSRLYRPKISRTAPLKTGCDPIGMTWPISHQLKVLGERKPIFCCSDLEIHQRTNPVVPKDFHEVDGMFISVFMASIGPELESPKFLPVTKFGLVDRIFKLNLVACGTEIATHLYALNDNDNTFMKLTCGDKIMPFNPQGKGGYQSYFCCKHHRMYRIGIYEKKFVPHKNRFSFGDASLDFHLGLMSQERMQVEYSNIMSGIFAWDMQYGE